MTKVKFLAVIILLSSLFLSGCGGVDAGLKARQVYLSQLESEYPGITEKNPLYRYVSMPVFIFMGVYGGLYGTFVSVLYVIFPNNNSDMEEDDDIEEYDTDIPATNEQDTIENTSEISDNY
ncbi:MAG: hypothetical protein LBQ34_04500 [Alphaproteobacteria bacterium]|jgi:hypothetical protein|nr:hypothetical protein [Alphaproteobacteria bacterium]